MRALLIPILFAVGCLVVAPSAPVAADKPAGKKIPAHKAALAEARKRLLAGNYDEARTAYEAAVSKDKTLAPYAASLQAPGFSKRAAVGAAAPVAAGQKCPADLDLAQLGFMAIVAA